MEGFVSLANGSDKNFLISEMSKSVQKSSVRAISSAWWKEDEYFRVRSVAFSLGWPEDLSIQFA